jgi:hypothetical protein
MLLALKIFGVWLLVSCTLGPCLTWLFFFGVRRENDRDEDHSNHKCGAPVAPLDAPSRRRYSDAPAKE